MVLRQFGARQFVPITSGLKTSEFVYYGDHYKKTARVMSDAWKSIFRTDLVAAEVMLTPDYVAWRAARKNDVIPLADRDQVIPLETQFRHVPSKLEILKSEFEAEIARKEAECEALRQKNFVLDIDKGFYNKQFELMRERKEKVEANFANLQNDYRRIVGLEKTSKQWRLELKAERDRRVRDVRAERERRVRELEAEKKRKDHELESEKKSWASALNNERKEAKELRQRHTLSKKREEELTFEVRRLQVNIEELKVEEHSRLSEIKEGKRRIEQLEIEKNNMFQGFEMEVNSMQNELEIRGQRIGELEAEKRRTNKELKLERQHKDHVLKSKHDEVFIWMQRCVTKNERIEVLNQEMQEIEARHEEKLTQAQAKNEEYGVYIRQLENSLFTENSQRWPSDLRVSLEENDALRRKVNDLENALRSCQIQISSLERTVESTRQQWQNSSDRLKTGKRM
ncbi:trichohyalin-like [Hibiscus syriacus]|uniref:trichohyalin-like n=1 Tax=Hibiscus syriacus TaxID=106335 RepID=UPI001920E61C|nr:trichohyalin-like [Hibiscus syriacus]